MIKRQLRSHAKYKNGKNFFDAREFFGGLNVLHLKSEYHPN